MEASSRKLDNKSTDFFYQVYPAVESFVSCDSQSSAIAVKLQNPYTAWDGEKSWKRPYRLTPAGSMVETAQAGGPPVRKLQESSRCRGSLGDALTPSILVYRQISRVAVALKAFAGRGNGGGEACREEGSSSRDTNLRSSIASFGITDL